MLTEIMYRLFLESLDYAKDIDLAELEIGLEQTGRLAAFEDAYRSQFGKAWRDARGLLAFATSEASAIMQQLEPNIYPMADSWAKGRAKPVLTTGLFADRVVDLMARRKPGHSLVFVIDEVGQFVARDVQKMLDLQAIVQQLGIRGRGKYWTIVTSQERLNELVSGLDDKKIELARVMDRFPMQVHLESSDISEVTSRRVLRKNAAAEATLGTRQAKHLRASGGRCRENRPRLGKVMGPRKTPLKDGRASSPQLPVCVPPTGAVHFAATRDRESKPQEPIEVQLQHLAPFWLRQLTERHSQILRYARGGMRQNRLWGHR